MRILFPVVAIAVLLLLHGYVGWRVLSPFRLVQPWKSIVWTAIFLLALMPPASLALRFNRVETVFNDFLSWFSYIALGFVSILFFFVLVKDLAVLIGLVAAKIHLSLGDGPATVLPESGESRRQMLLTSFNLAAIGLTGLLTGCGFVQARHRIRVEQVVIPLKNLPAPFEGLRIVQISDIHVGPTIKGGFVRQIVERVNDLKPDIIVLTGDLVDGSVEYLAEDVAPLRDLKAPDGRYFVTGNHDYYSGVLPWLEKVSQLGFDSLINEHRVLERDGSQLVLGGVTDISAGHMVPGHTSDPQASLRGAPETAVRILLAHQPVSVFQAARAGYDLQLSGHTHGGQYFPYSKLIGVAQPFVAGLYRHEKTWLYVNRGTGYWGPPIRLGSPAEITEIILSGRSA